MIDDKILDRIRKILARAKSSNANEAATAAELAHKLMLEHRIAISDVSDALPADVVEEEIHGERMMAVWRFGLLTACARSYYCSTVRVEELTTLGTKRIIAIVMGRKDDVAAVRCLFEHMEREIDRFWGKKFDHGRVPGNLTIPEIESEESWKRGVVVAIQDKLRGQRMMFERGSTRAMVLGDKAREAVDDYARKKYPETYRPQMGGKAVESAFSRGYRAGLDVGVPEKEQGRIEDGEDRKVSRTEGRPR